MAAKPVVLPEPFDGTTSWEEWLFHFENVAEVNAWDDAQKLRWIRVRLTNRAQRALQHLPEASRATYAATKAALKARFDPESRQTRYQAEFQARRKKPSEGWADFAEDLQSLVDKAYPALQYEARERLAINSYLQQLTDPQVAFSVRQKRPETLDDAVTATLEMESYALPTGHGAVSTLQPESEPESEAVSVAAIDPIERLTSIVERLSEQVETLKLEASKAAQPPADSDRDRRNWRGRENRRELDSRGTRRQSTGPRAFDGQCWNCHRRGHIARNCTQDRPSGQGN